MERAAAKFVGCQAILWALALFMVLPTLRVLASENDLDDPTAIEMCARDRNGVSLYG